MWEKLAAMPNRRRLPSDCHGRKLFPHRGAAKPDRAGKAGLAPGIGKHRLPEAGSWLPKCGRAAPGTPTYARRRCIDGKTRAEPGRSVFRTPGDISPGNPLRASLAKSPPRSRVDLEW